MLAFVNSLIILAFCTFTKDIYLKKLVFVWSHCLSDMYMRRMKREYRIIG